MSLSQIKNELEEILEVKQARAQGVCFSCKKPFTEENVFTTLGWKETQISQMCEKCFDDLWKDIIK